MKRRTLLLLISMALMSFQLQAQTIINGLTVLVNYSGLAFGHDTATVSNMLNQNSGFTAWGNNGSVKEYFYHQTGGKVTINSKVIEVTVNKTYAFYHQGNGSYNGGEEFAKDVVASMRAAYPAGFSNLTKHPIENRLWHFSVLSSSPGPHGIGVAYGFDLGLSVLNNGVEMPIRNVCVAAYVTPATPEMNVICHEFGHSIFGWTDYYNIDKERHSNTGHYCLMGSGGRNGHPMHISAPLRYKKGWIDNVIDITNSTTQIYTATSNEPNQVYKYTNVKNPKEYYLIEPYTHSKYYLDYTGDKFWDTGIHYVPDQGLAIWYVDEDNGLDNPGFTPDLKIKLVQADGMDEMRDRTKTHHDHRGDYTDLFNDAFPVFNDSLYSNFRWRNGNETGLIITDISPIGSTMTFKVNARANTVDATAGINGKIVPGGLVNVPTGTDKTFSFIPEIGYEVDYVTVNNVNQGSINSYTFNNISGNQTVHVQFKKSTSGYELPSPWLHSKIGSQTNEGVCGYKNGVFGIETHGADIYNQSDDFNYVYRAFNGNGEIIARVASINNPHEWSKSGVMFRESVNANSKYIMLVKTPWNGLAPQFRPETGGWSYHNQGGTNNLDTLRNANWLRITRTGTEFKSYYSHNGTSWTLLETTYITMNTNIYVGLCASGATGSTPNKATFDQVKINGVLVGGNIAPSVSITAPSNNYNFTAPATVSITANATDSDGTISKVEFYEGTNLLTTVYTSPYTYSWTNVQAGSYSLTARAYDNLNASTVSSAITITGTTSGSCNDPQYVAGTTYANGTVVKNNGRKYECNVGGWCSSPSAWAYEPGVGSAWQSAWTDIGICGSSGNQSPTVSITSPAANASYNAPASVSINASASDSDGSISKVEFYEGTNLLGTSYASPYTYTWTSVTSGNYSLTAKAFDNENASTVSSAVAIVVNAVSNQAPTVTITSPANNASYTAQASVTITANATDSDGTISKVEFYEGTNLLTTVYTSPYTYSWTGVAAGSYSLTAKAFDNNNASTTSAAVNIEVNSSGTCTAAIWNAGSSYSTGNIVQYNGIKYIANWWTMNQRPDLNNGPNGSGQPWTSQGTCNSKFGTYSTSETAAIKIVPNPVVSNSIINLVQEADGMATIYIIDQFGKKVIDLYEGTLASGEHSFDMNTMNLSKGIYTLVYINQTRPMNISFVKM